MSARTERPQVRTAQDLERKYAALFGMETAIKQSQTGLIKVNNILNDFITATIGDLETLQNQLDGQIDTWYGSYEPTLLNEPVSNWQVSEYSDHIGDLFYDNSTGATYQFTEDNGTYSWGKVDSSLMSEILSMANAAKDTADNKRRVFIGTPDNPYPTPPYDRGDIWVKNVGNTTGEIYICQIPKANGSSYSNEDFIIATKYTDDTTAVSAQRFAEQVQKKGLEVEATAEALKFNFTNRIILNDGSSDPDNPGKIVASNPSTITFEDGAIVFAAGNSDPTITKTIRLRIDNDSIEFQDNEGNTFAHWSATAGTSNTTTLNLGDFQFKVRQDNGSLDFNHI